MTLDLFNIALVVVAGFTAGLVNAIAGGGTFFSFPALIFAGVPPVSANATNSVALWPASLAGAWAYRGELRQYGRALVPLALIAVCGGVAGGLTLIAIREAVFEQLIPWLLLFATLLFAASRRIAAHTARLRTQKPSGVVGLGLRGLAYFGVAVYGGFFGAGMGILLLAALSMDGFENIHEVNAMKNLLSAAVYSVSVVTFIVAGVISWKAMAVMLVGTTLGGFYGAQLSRLIPAAMLRWLVIAVGLTLSAVYFVKTS